MVGFIIGMLGAQFAGSWAYWRVRANRPEWLAASAAGLVATIVGSLIYIPLHVHDWLGGQGSSWGLSIFMALCVGICQGALFKGRPLRPRSARSTLPQ